FAFRAPAGDDLPLAALPGAAERRASYRRRPTERSESVRQVPQRRRAELRQHVRRIAARRGGELGEQRPPEDETARDRHAVHAQARQPGSARPDLAHIRESHSRPVQPNNLGGHPLRLPSRPSTRPAPLSEKLVHRGLIGGRKLVLREFSRRDPSYVFYAQPIPPPIEGETARKKRHMHVAFFVGVSFFGGLVRDLAPAAPR